MHIYPGQMYPPQIKPRTTEPNYTKAVSDIAQCTYTLVRCIYRYAHLPRSDVPPKSNPELQRPTTPKQFPI